MDVAHLPAALKIFDEIRRPFAQGVQRASDENGHLFQLHRVGWENITPAESAAGAFPPEWLAVVAQRLEEEGEWALTAGASPQTGNGRWRWWTRYSPLRGSTRTERRRR